MIPEEDLMTKGSAYYREAMLWQQEIYSKATASARRAWTVATVSGTIALLLAFVLAVMMPLKATELRVVEVDRITGETHISQRIQPGMLTQIEVLKKYWVNQYILARLPYDYQDFETNYIKVRQLSDRSEFNRYHDAVDPNREDSLYQTLGERTRISVRVKAISFLDADTASVRLSLTETGPVLGSVKPSLPYVATLSFQFTNSPSDEADRLANPLGFQVTQYRLDAEVAGQAER